MRHDPRSPLISRASCSEECWDVIVVGGGASGLSVAWDAVSRGLRVALLEQHDFCQGTSSRSTKLVHGGVRYLQKFELGLVREALLERHRLLENAAEFCRPLNFVLPTTGSLSRYYYRLGLCLYDLLASSSRLDGSRLLNKSETQALLPSLQLEGLRGGVSYSDAQFDDTGLALGMVQAISNSGGLALNYVKINSLIKHKGSVTGVAAVDVETGREWKMQAKVVINATGIFSDEFRKENGIEREWAVRQSRGSHIVCPQNVLPSNNALIIPKTADGRVLFAIPWMGHTVIGTTDIPVSGPVIDPQPTEQEMEFLIAESGRALGVKPSDVLSRWAGLRPLVSRRRVRHTKSLSRKHVVEVSRGGLISILGGKWTTARAMAEDTVDMAMKVHGLKAVASTTAQRRLVDHGAMVPLTCLDSSPRVSRDLVEKAIRYYHARSAEDVLSRRLRATFLDPAAIEKDSKLVLDTFSDYFDWDALKYENESLKLADSIQRFSGNNEWR